VQPRPAHAVSPLVAKADAICDELNRRLADVHVSSTDDHELARITPVSAALEEQAIRDLSVLTPPASLARDWQQMMGYRRTLARELKQLGRAAKAKDEHRVQSLIASKKLVHHKLELIATHAGLVACARLG
jgi:cell division inhibitor SulA